MSTILKIDNHIYSDKVTIYPELFSLLGKGKDIHLESHNINVVWTGFFFICNYSIVIIDKNAMRLKFRSLSSCTNSLFRAYNEYK